MPAPVQDLIVTPVTAPITVSLEPALNAVHSLVLVAKKDVNTGLSDWVNETILSMSSQEQRRHRLVMIGLFYAVKPLASWSSFPAYLDHLATLPPHELRGKLMQAYMQLPCTKREFESSAISQESALESTESYLTFLRQRFSPEHIDAELEEQAYAYIMDPPAMQRLIVSHLRNMWDNHLAKEWQRVEPMLRDAVTAFGQVDFRTMSRLEAVRFVTGRQVDEDHWQEVLELGSQLIFVPSAHVGPYLGKFLIGDTLAIVFGARLPEGLHFDAPDLSRAEVLVRLAALADDTRLRILKLIAEEGEKRSQEIIRRLELSQSAASRHLKQLSATGYLLERRCEGAKCYELNTERIDDTLGAISTFLLGT